MSVTILRFLSLCGLLLATGVAATAQAGNILWGDVIDAYGVAKVYVEDEEDFALEEDELFELGLIDISESVSLASARAGVSLAPRSIMVGASGDVAEEVEDYGAAGAYAEGGVAGSFSVDADGSVSIPLYLDGLFATPEGEQFDWYGSAYAAGAAAVGVFDQDFNELYFGAGQWDEEDGSIQFQEDIVLDLFAGQTYFYQFQAKAVTEISHEDLALTKNESFNSFAGLAMGLGDPPVSPVPEPTTMALFGLGLASAVVVARRRGRSASRADR